MTRDDIIRMAGESGLRLGYSFAWDHLEQFAALVAASERESCALILDRNAEVCHANSPLRDVLEGNAAAIRARGDK